MSNNTNGENIKNDKDEMVFNIFMTGVGGQGIGLLSEVLLRTIDSAGFTVKAVDTHGLAQRGGIVISHLRIGKKAHSALIPVGQTDLLISLETHEAYRGLNTQLKNGGTLLYYQVNLQPLAVRAGKAKAATDDDIAAKCQEKQVRCLPVFHPELPDSRMQNMVLLAAICQHKLIPGVTISEVKTALEAILSGPALEQNLKILSSNA
jgi:indolepyruvate ferredoxin oxidoreductase beta subunit